MSVGGWEFPAIEEQLPTVPRDVFAAVISALFGVCGGSAHLQWCDVVG